jgi:hypothetical protein
MLRLVELVLFLMPFAGYGLWLLGGRRYTGQILWGTLGIMLVLLFTAAWLELSGAVPPTMQYVPPHMEDGRIVPGQAVRRPPQ